MSTDTTTQSNSMGGYAHIDGLDLYYETHGAGRPMVLLHVEAFKLPRPAARGPVDLERAALGHVLDELEQYATWVERVGERAPDRHRLAIAHRRT